jgi:predicted ATPase
VPGVPDAAERAIAAHSQGIPLYAVETIRMLVDKDVVRPTGGVYRLVGDIGELPVPSTLQSLLAARLDALDATTRSRSPTPPSSAVHLRPRRWAP